MSLKKFINKSVKINFCGKIIKDFNIKMQQG